MRHRDAGHPGAAFRVRDVARQPIGIGLLEGERHRDDPAVELRHRHLGGDVERARGPRSESAQASRDQVRHSPCRIGMSSAASAVTSHASSSPPAVAVAGLVPPAASTVTINASKVASGASRSSGAPRRDEQKIGTATAAVLRLHGIGQGVHERRVPGRLMRPVVQDADPRGVSVRPRRTGRSSRPQAGSRVGGSKPCAGEQHRVADKRVQLSEIARPALGQVLVGLRGHPDRHRGVPHQLRVRGLLAAQHDHRHADRADRVQPVLPGPRRAENPDDHQVGGVEQRGQIGRDVQPGRVGQCVLGAGRAGRQQVGVGRGQQGDAGHGSPFAGWDRRSSVPSHSPRPNRPATQAGAQGCR